MTGIQGKLLRSGKVKDIYEVEEGLIFHFTDRVSAFDVILPSTIPRKGEVLCKFARFWFDVLNSANHYVRMLSKDKLLVKKLRMIPIECVVRGYLYGSLYERVMKGEVKLRRDTAGTFPNLAEPLPEPIFDPTTKSETKDVPISKEEVLRKNIADKDTLDILEVRSIALYEQMASIARKANFIIADVKFEFGLDADGRVILADSVGPDEFRLWPLVSYSPGKTQESYDKQLVRDWLIQQGYKQKLDEGGKKGFTPPPPVLPKELIQSVTERYIHAYESITGRPIDQD